MKIIKYTNVEGEFILAIQTNPKSPIKIIGVFEDYAQMNEHYETVMVTLKVLNKKVIVIDNI